METAVDRYVSYDELPNGTQPYYHCPALDALAEVVDSSKGGACAKAPEYLTNNQNEEWWRGVQQEERIQEQLARLRSVASK